MKIRNGATSLNIEGKTYCLIFGHRPIKTGGKTWCGNCFDDLEDEHEPDVAESDTLRDSERSE